MFGPPRTTKMHNCTLMTLNKAFRSYYIMFCFICFYCAIRFISYTVSKKYSYDRYFFNLFLISLLLDGRSDSNLYQILYRPLVDSNLNLNKIYQVVRFIFQNKAQQSKFLRQKSIRTKLKTILFSMINNWLVLFSF